MSVRVNQRGQGDLVVIEKAKELAVHTLRVTRNEDYFPKRYRLTLTDKMVNKSIDIFTLLLEANEINPNIGDRELQMRLQKQRMAMAACRTLAALIDISKTTFNLPARKCEYWMHLIFDVRNMTAAWYKSDIMRSHK